MIRNIISILINVPITLIALTGHELAHAWISNKLGDPTPKREGRLSLNPLAHLDLVGTLLMIFTGFGWAKPVSINPMYYKNRKKGMALTAAAGPNANFIMSVIAVLIGALTTLICNIIGLGEDIDHTVNLIMLLFAQRNLCFMVFNFIPIPPLDGSKVLGLIIPNRIYYQILQYEQYSIILIMILSVSGVFDSIIGNGVYTILSGIYNTIGMIVYPFV